MTMLKVTTNNVSMVTKHRDELASIYVLEQKNSNGLSMVLETYLSVQR